MHYMNFTASYGLHCTGLLVCVEISYLCLSLSWANEWDRGVEICRQDNTLPAIQGWPLATGHWPLARYTRVGQVYKG